MELKEINSLLQVKEKELSERQRLREQLLSLSDQDLASLGLEGLINRDKLEEYKSQDAELTFAKDAARSMLYESEERQATSLADTMKKTETFNYDADLGQGLLDTLTVKEG